MSRLNGRLQLVPLHLAIVALAFMFYVFFVIRTRFTIGGETYYSLFDDAMISMRYARHLANGFGLAWNPFERPVEGYTNLLWTLWMALVHFLPIPESKTSLAIMVSGILILSGNLAIVYRLTKNIVPTGRWSSVIALALVAFYYPLVYWTLRGLEVGFLAFLVDCSLLLAFQINDIFSSKKLWLLALLLAVALLVRDDAIVPALVVAAYVCLSVKREHRVLCACALLGGLSATALGHTAFRLYYYGDILPNTYYLKMTGVPLTERLERGVWTYHR